MTVNELEPKVAQWLKVVPDFKTLTTKLVPLVKSHKITWKYKADLEKVWLDIHDQTITWNDLKPVQVQEIGSQVVRQPEHIEPTTTYSRAYSQEYMNEQDTDRLLMGKLNVGERKIWNIIKDKKIHIGKEILAETMDGDYRKKLSVIRRMLDGFDPHSKSLYQSWSQSIYELPKNEAHQDGVYQLKKRV